MVALNLLFLNALSLRGILGLLMGAIMDGSFSTPTPMSIYPALRMSLLTGLECKNVVSSRI
jgi:hypothetical protein